MASPPLQCIHIKMANKASQKPGSNATSSLYTDFTQHAITQCSLKWYN